MYPFIRFIGRLITLSGVVLVVIVPLWINPPLGRFIVIKLGWF
jgi:hypothetical protein